MTNHPLPYSHLTNEELLAKVYMDRVTMTPLALELAQRLEWALDAARKGLTSIDDVLDGVEGKYGNDA